MRTAKTVSRLGGCPGWSEASLGAHVILLVLSWGGSYGDSWSTATSFSDSETVTAIPETAMNLSLSPRCSTTKLLLPSPLQSRMAMISLRPADNQGEKRNLELKTEHDEHRDMVSEEKKKREQNQFNAFRPWVSEEEKEQESRVTDDEYGELKRAFTRFSCDCTY